MVKEVISALFISLLRVAVLTVLLILLIDGFLLEALTVATKEGQAEWAVEAMQQLIKQGKLFFTTLTAIL